MPMARIAGLTAGLAAELAGGLATGLASAVATGVAVGRDRASCLGQAPSSTGALRPAVAFAVALSLLVLVGLLAVADASARKGFHVTAVETRLVDGVIEMDAQIDYGFSETALEALANGVPLTVDVHIQVRGSDAWVWEPSLVDLRLSYRIRYRPLSEQYLVTRLPGSVGVTYVTREAALVALGDVRNVQLLQAERLEPGRDYEVQLRVSLDLEELPLPLRPSAYLSRDWKHASAWTKWPLRS